MSTEQRNWDEIIANYVRNGFKVVEEGEWTVAYNPCGYPLHKELTEHLNKGLLCNSMNAGQGMLLRGYAEAYERTPR